MKRREVILKTLILTMTMAFALTECRKPDYDGMPDDWEKQYGLNPYDPADANLDKDNDGLLNKDEYIVGTDPMNPDTDQDGMTDGDEIKAHPPAKYQQGFSWVGVDPTGPKVGPDPKNPDTDGDGDPDGKDCEPVNSAINHSSREGPLADPTCADLVDNDCDGLIDLKDADCGCAKDSECPAAKEICEQTICEQGLCRIKPLPEGASCNDQNPCTEHDQCRTGMCVGRQKTCPLYKACDLATGACSINLR